MARWVILNSYNHHLDHEISRTFIKLKIFHVYKYKYIHISFVHLWTSYEWINIYCFMSFYLLTTIFVKSIHFCSNSSFECFPFHFSVILYCIIWNRSPSNFFFHSNHLRAITINSTLNILIHFFGYAFIPISVNYMPRIGILRTSCRCMLNPDQQWQLSKGLYQLVIYAHREFLLLYILTNSKLHYWWSWGYFKCVLAKFVCLIFSFMKCLFKCLVQFFKWLSLCYK